LPFYVWFGFYGVQLFFIISGFVIFMTLERTHTVMDFVVSRFARLYPTYWAAIIITTFNVWLFFLPSGEVPLSATLINFSMLQAWFSVPHLEEVYWTLEVELAFYALVLALFALGSLKKINFVAIGWMCAMLVVVWEQKLTGNQIHPILRLSFILDYANLFLAGIMFYKLYQQDRALSTKLVLIAAAVVEFIIYGPAMGIVTMLFFALFLAVVFQVRSVSAILSFKPLVYIGTISYSFYLIHENTGYGILSWLYAYQISPNIAIPVAFLGAFALAACLNRLVEIPSREAIRGFWSRRKTKLSVVSSDTIL
jgi:peptidoglycan/LPS O-acetylase OafA/YrhL